MNAIEKNVIGMCLASQTNLVKVLSTGLMPEHFSEQTRPVFAAIRRLAEEHKPVDLTVVDAVTERRFTLLLTECLTEAPMCSNPAAYADELLKDNWKRQMATDLSNLGKRVMALKPFDDIRDVMADIGDLVRRCHADFGVSPTRWMKDLVPALLQVIEQRVKDKMDGRKQMMSTGLEKLDEYIRGFYPGRMYVLAARTSIGKTTMAVNFLNSVADQGYCGMFFTVEMTDMDVCEKMVSLEGMVPWHGLQEGSMSDDELDRLVAAFRKMQSKRAGINYKARTIRDIEIEIRRVKESVGLDFVVVDYIQKFGEEDKEGRSKELAAVSNKLKVLSLELGIPVVVLAQLNRNAAVEEVPELHHIRDCGAIEQDADVVMFLHRKDDKMASSYHLAVAKNRYGATGNFQVYADLSVNKFFGSR